MRSSPVQAKEANRITSKQQYEPGGSSAWFARQRYKARWLQTSHPCGYIVIYLPREEYLACRRKKYTTRFRDYKNFKLVIMTYIAH